MNPAPLRPSRPWFVGPPSAAPGALRLFCFPFAGGQASYFHPWRGPLGPQVEVVGVEYPGRGTRFSHPPPASLAAVAEEVTQALAPFTHQPYALYGHSMGGVAAFEVLHRLRARGLPGPRACIVSGRPAPHFPWRLPRYSEWEDGPFLTAVKGLGGLTEEVAAHPELMELLLPILRTDFRMCEQHPARPPEPVETPLFIYSGLRDTELSREELEGWRLHSARFGRLRLFPGGHFFIQSDLPAVLAALRDDLA